MMYTAKAALCSEIRTKHSTPSEHHVIPRNWDCQLYSAPSPRTTQELKLRIQEEILRIPVDVLRRAMSSVHDQLAECEQCNGGHLEDGSSGMMCCVLFCVLCYVSRPLIHLFLQMLNYVLPYKCSCIMISNIFNISNT